MYCSMDYGRLETTGSEGGCPVETSPPPLQSQTSFGSSSRTEEGIINMGIDLVYPFPTEKRETKSFSKPSPLLTLIFSSLRFVRRICLER